MNLRLSILPLLLVFLSSCSRDPGGYKIAVVPELRGQNGIFVMNSDTTGGRLLTPEATAQLRASSWFPDGKKIAFFVSGKRATSQACTDRVVDPIMGGRSYARITVQVITRWVVSSWPEAVHRYD